MIRLHSEGSGPAVLLIHGAPFNGEHFAPLVEALSPYRRVLVVDLPGYQGLPTVSGPESFQRTQELMEAQLRELGIRELAIVGFSGGSYRAVGLAVSRQVRVTHLVTLAGYARLDAETRAAFREGVRRLRGGENLSEMLPGMSFRPGFLEAHPELREEIVNHTAIHAPLEVADEVESYAESPAFEHDFAKLTIPITARTGALDALIPVQWTVNMQELNPGVNLEVVPGCGHALLYEDREGTIASVLRGLEVT